MLRGWNSAVVLLVLAGSACSGTQNPVPVSGSEADLAQLAGEWTGEYSSIETGRSGSIIFHLIAGTDSAHGDVMMAPTGMGANLPRDPTDPAMAPRAPQVIAIRFVRIAGGRVSGLLAPYTDPECNCAMTTVFEGRQSGDVLEGTYTSHREGSSTELKGRWRVTRGKP